MKSATRFLLQASLCTLALITGCQSLAKSVFPGSPKPVPSIQTRPMNSSNSSVNFQVVDFGHTPLHERYQPVPKAVVFQTSDNWTRFWRTSRRLDANLQKPQAPKVDFQQQTIVGITSGSHPTGGYGLRIDRIELKRNPAGDRWVVHYQEMAPASSCLVTQEPTTPVVFISLPKTTLPIDLQGQRTATSC